MSRSPGHVFWIFGLSGSGKTTLATDLIVHLRGEGRPVLSLDGDVLRAGLCRGLGFTDADRTENLRRAAEVAKLSADAGIIVVAAFITPLTSHRQLVAEIIGRPRLSLIFADAPLETCRLRDTKGLYAGAAAGRVAHLTAVSASFEAAVERDLVIETGRESPSDSSAKLARFATARLRGGF